MMDIAEKFQKLGVVPVVVLEDTKRSTPCKHWHSLSTAKAAEE